MQFQLFIPGKNWRLSLAELVSFLENRGIKFAMCSLSKEFFVVSTEEKVGASIIDDLGGTIKIGVSAADFSTEIVRSAFVQKDKEAQAQIVRDIVASGLVDEMFKSESERTLFGVSVYCAEKQLRSVYKVIQRFIGSSIKRELAGYGKKSKFMGFAKDRKLPQLSHIEVLKKNLVENKAEILFCVGREQTFVATTIAVHNPFEFQKRDVGKPVQRKIFAIPPRLARIMVNLAVCTKGKVVLDPFCGVGTILQEALLAKSKAIGVDINRWCVEATMRNLEWLKDEYALENAEYRVLQGDVHKLSQKIGWEQVDCIATEPDLGPALRQIPTTSYAVRIAEKLEPLYYGLLEEAYKVLKSGGRLVLVSPYIKARSGNPVTMGIEKKAVAIGFERVYPFKRGFFAEDAAVPENLISMASLIDAEERHKIGREIHVFQK
ncbi:methyltransferase domain-containing protein [Candidatus Bathyarchaeota archaeon]|nr:methyltransferase domain-containing protein [Candidatus Bathyarchaeota archaeon]